MNSVAFILVSPQMGENIGAVARAISNFGYVDLRIVAPRDGWPNEKALAMAAHASFVINNAKIYDSLAEAIENLNIVIATSANDRSCNMSSISPRQFFSQYNDNVNSSLGIVLGRESSGLSNEEISYANHLIKIPTSSINPSMNLAQAACILAYELYNNNYRINEADYSNAEISLAVTKKSNAKLSEYVKTNDSVLCSCLRSSHQIKHQDQENILTITLARILKNRANSAEYYDENKLQILPQKIRQMILKANLTKQEVKLLHWLLRNI